MYSTKEAASNRFLVRLYLQAFATNLALSDLDVKQMVNNVDIPPVLPVFR